MVCYNPRLAFRRFDGTRIKFTRLSWSSHIVQQDGTYRLKPQFNNIFSEAKNVDLTKPLKIPCGKCQACVLNKAAETAKRAYDEFRCPSTNPNTQKAPPQPFHGMFITLTYSDDTLPSCGHFMERDINLFVKRLRKLASNQLRTLGVAEYGERTKRPHYHLLVFGWQFPDKKISRKTDSTHTGQEYDIFTSKILQDTWDLGITEFGSVTEQSCSYVARYLHKKVNVKEIDGKPCGQCENERPNRSKIVCRSRRPGLGAAFADKYIGDSRITVAALQDGPGRDTLPRYYVDRARKASPRLDILLSQKGPDFQKCREGEISERLEAAKEIDNAKLKHLKRSL